MGCPHIPYGREDALQSQGIQTLPCGVQSVSEGLHPAVFPSGARINDRFELLQGNYKDGRRLAFFRTMKRVQSREKGPATGHQNVAGRTRQTMLIRVFVASPVVKPIWPSAESTV